MAKLKRNYRELIQAGNKAQLEKLKANGHKKGFDNIDLNYAIKRLNDELKEIGCEQTRYNLCMACEKESGVYQENTPEIIGNIRHEAADIANFAHMIILKCDKEIAKC